MLIVGIKNCDQCDFDFDVVFVCWLVFYWEGGNSVYYYLVVDSIIMFVFGDFVIGNVFYVMFGYECVYSVGYDFWFNCEFFYQYGKSKEIWVFEELIVEIGVVFFCVQFGMELIE